MPVSRQLLPSTWTSTKRCTLTAKTTSTLIIPKAYQISQFDEPIGYNGWIEVELEDGTTKKIGIERAHLEEDAGKNTHGTDGYSYVDLNRQGVPLIEIVSEADMRSPEEAYAYLTALKEVIQYAGISDVKMEEGSMRVDANISLRPYGQEKIRHQD